MSIEPATVVPILAVPFGIVRVQDAPALNPALAAVFAARSAAAGVGPDVLSHQSRDDLLEWPEEPVRRLGAAMLQGVQSVIAAVHETDPIQTGSLRVQARGWYTLIRQHGSVPATNHPLTAWCAIYCVAAPPLPPLRPECGILRLHESRPGTMFADASTALMRLPFTAGHHGWRPLPGHMAVFPAALTHEIAVLRTPGELLLVTMRVRFVGAEQSGLVQW